MVVLPQLRKHRRTISACCDENKMKFRNKKANATLESTHVTSLSVICKCKSISCAVSVYQQKFCLTVPCQKLFVISEGETEQGMFYNSEMLT